MKGEAEISIKVFMAVCLRGFPSLPAMLPELEGNPYTPSEGHTQQYIANCLSLASWRAVVRNYTAYILREKIFTQLEAVDAHGRQQSAKSQDMGQCPFHTSAIQSCFYQGPFHTGEPIGYACQFYRRTWLDPPLSSREWTINKVRVCFTRQHPIQ